MNPEQQSLILQHHVVKHADTALHVREVSLRLHDDHNELVLSDYSENYSPDGLQWVERIHRVPLAEMLSWLLTHGASQVVTQGGETAERPTPQADCA